MFHVQMVLSIPVITLPPLVCFGKYKEGTENSRPLVGTLEVSPNLYLMYNLCIICMYMYNYYYCILCIIMYIYKIYV